MFYLYQPLCLYVYMYIKHTFSFLLLLPCRFFLLCVYVLFVYAHCFLCISCIWYIRFICISLFYWTCMRFIGIHLSFLNTCKTQHVLFVYAFFFFTCIRFICICHFLFIQLHTMCCVCIDMFFCKFLVYAFNLFAMSGLVLLSY